MGVIDLNSVIIYLIMETVRIKKKYQITIPKKIREKLRISEGDRLKMDVKNDELMIKVMAKENPSDILWNLFGKPINIDAVKIVEESWE